jgi:glyceraldehyde 3-phosphate dehydrogenase
VTYRVAINGFGRIGRLVFRVLELDDRFDVVAINDLADPATLVHLARYDSTHGRFRGTISVADGNALEVNGRKVKITSERDPANLPWKAERVDWVVESTGVFTKRAQIEAHLAAGAGRVLLTVPPKDEIDAIVVMGVNEEVVRPEHRILSNASCTTNCLAPVAKVLHESFGIVQGFMSTVHAYTNDQRILDLVHKDLRRARSAAVNMIPTSTGAARAVGKVLPALKGRLDGSAIRVPVPDGSIVDLTARVERPTTVEEVNAVMREAAEGPLTGILEYCTDPVVSTDIIGNPASSVFDSLCTMVNGDLVKVMSWYDNEWGYSNRVVDLMAHASSVGK